MNVVIYVYDGMTMLDAIGPYEILRNVKKTDIKFVSKEKGEIKADTHFIHINYLLRTFIQKHTVY